MILKCNSCDKKFVVPDSAITATGRMVQCGSCGNKWNQYPVKIETSKPIINKKINITKTSILTKNSKPKKKKAKKSREIDLYSPEYLEKKHGISLNNSKTSNNVASNKKAYFGFYNSFIVFTILVIAFSRSLYFFQDFIVKSLPFSKFYLDYFFESINNIFEIIKNLISNY